MLDVAFVYGAALLSFIIVGGITWGFWQLLVTYEPSKHIWDIFLNELGYPSLSKVQFFVWTIIIAFSYITIYIIRFSVGEFGPPPGLSENILVLLSVSAIVPVGSARLNRYLNRSVKPVSTTPPTKILWRYMLLENEEPALHRYQMVLWTCISVTIYVIVIFTTITNAQILSDVAQKLVLPDIDGKLVILMGLSQGAYLGGKTFSKKSKPSVQVLQNDD
jgi:hypothetical protein